MHIELQDETMVCACSDQLSCDLDGEAAILHVPSGIYFGLDDVGARVWELALQSKPVSAIVGALCEEYDVDESTCRADLAVLLREMNEAGLVELRT